MGAAASDYFTAYSDVQYGFLDEELAILNFHELAAKGDFHRVSICLKKGLDPNRPAFDDDDDYAREDTPMICAARGNAVRRGRKRHLKTLEVLLRFGGNVNKCNYLEQTPLYVACEKNLFNVAQWLVIHGSDVNKSTKAGVSPLLCAYRNGNAAMAKLLLDHDAKVIDPPRDFCSIHFPTVAKELRGENMDQQGEDVDASIASSESDDDALKARPVSSYLRIRPPWRQAANIETPESPALPALTARPTTATAAPAVTDIERMRLDIEEQQRRQQQQRDEILSVLDEKRRIDEQREYRAKLAVDNAKRKAHRKLKRDKANYDKYIARVEEKRLQHLAPLRVTTSHCDPRRASASQVAPSVVSLQWSKQPMQIDALHEQRRSVRTAPSRLGRPTWVAQEVHTTQVAQSTAASRQAGDERLMQESRAVFDTLLAQRDRREQLRTAYTAPTTGGLPPLALRSETKSRSTRSLQPETVP